MNRDESHHEDVAQQHEKQRLLHPLRLRAKRQQRQRDAEQTVEAEFLQHTGVQHGD